MLVQIRYKFVRKEGIIGMARRVDVLACKPEELFLEVSQVSVVATSTEIFDDNWWKKENSHSSLLDNVGAYNSRYQFRMEVIGTTRIRYNSSFVY